MDREYRSPYSNGFGATTPAGTGEAVWIVPAAATGSQLSAPLTPTSAGLGFSSQYVDQQPQRSDSYFRRKQEHHAAVVVHSRTPPSIKGHSSVRSDSGCDAAHPREGECMPFGDCRRRLSYRDWQGTQPPRGALFTKEANDYQPGSDWLSPIGQNKVIFSGICLIGPNVVCGLLSLGLIIVPSILFDVVIAPWYSGRVELGFMVGVFAGCLQFLVVLLFIVTSCSDPGIIPRQRDPYNAYDVLTEGFRSKLPPRHQDIVVNGHIWKMKYCSTCNVYRPPRSVHCSVCDNCVEKFDHHCPWVGNCIGRRNYRRFYFFISAVTALILYVLCCSFAKLYIVMRDHVEKEGGFSKAVKTFWPDGWGALLLTVYSFGFIWFPASIGVFHSYLVVTNQTTYEQLKGTFQDDDCNPWDRGPFGNCGEALCVKARRRFFDSRNLKIESVYEPRVLREANHQCGQPANADGGLLRAAHNSARCARTTQEEIHLNYQTSSKAKGSQSSSQMRSDDSATFPMSNSVAVHRSQPSATNLPSLESFPPPMTNHQLRAAATERTTALPVTLGAAPLTAVGSSPRGYYASGQNPAAAAAAMPERFCNISEEDVTYSSVQSLSPRGSGPTPWTSLRRQTGNASVAASGGGGGSASVSMLSATDDSCSSSAAHVSATALSPQRTFDADFWPKNGGSQTGFNVVSTDSHKDVTIDREDSRGSPKQDTADRMHFQLSAEHSAVCTFEDEDSLQIVQDVDGEEEALLLSPSGVRCMPRSSSGSGEGWSFSSSGNVAEQSLDPAVTMTTTAAAAACGGTSQCQLRSDSGYDKCELIIDGDVDTEFSMATQRSSQSIGAFSLDGVAYEGDGEICRRAAERHFTSEAQLSAQMPFTLDDDMMCGRSSSLPHREIGSRQQSPADCHLQDDGPPPPPAAAYQSSDRSMLSSQRYSYTCRVVDMLSGSDHGRQYRRIQTGSADEKRCDRRGENNGTRSSSASSDGGGRELSAVCVMCRNSACSCGAVQDIMMGGGSDVINVGDLCVWTESEIHARSGSGGVGSGEVGEIRAAAAAAGSGYGRSVGSSGVVCGDLGPRAPPQQAAPSAPLIGRASSSGEASISLTSNRMARSSTTPHCCYDSCMTCGQQRPAVALDMRPASTVHCGRSRGRQDGGLASTRWLVGQMTRLVASSECGRVTCVLPEDEQED